MFSVAHLKLCSFFRINFYKQFIPVKSSNIYIEGDTDIYKNYKIKYLLN